MTDAKKASRGRPRKPGKTPFNFRMSESLRQRLSESAEQAGLSLTEEAELRLNRDFAWEASKQDIEAMKRDAAKLRDTEHLIALRLAGFQILRELDGRPTRVVVDLQSLLAEADGILARVAGRFHRRQRAVACGERCGGRVACAGGTGAGIRASASKRCRRARLGVQRRSRGKVA